MSEIKTFIKQDALAAVKADAETAGYLLAKAIGWEVKVMPNGHYAFRFQRPNEDAYNIIGCDELATDERLWQIHEAEKAVIEKVGGQYGAYLRQIVLAECEKQKINCGIGEIATASAEQRLAACLMAIADSSASSEEAKQATRTDGEESAVDHFAN